MSFLKDYFWVNTEVKNQLLGLNKGPIEKYLILLSPYLKFLPRMRHELSLRVDLKKHISLFIFLFFCS